MSNVAFDQLLQITAPPANTRALSSREPSDQGFRAHLDRAAEAADAKPRDAIEDSKEPSAEEDEGLTIQSGEQENATTENEELVDRAEQEQTTADEPTDEADPEGAIVDDEVTLSEAAVTIAAEASDESEGQSQTVSQTHQSLGTETANSQDQSGQDQTHQGQTAEAQSQVSAQTSEVVPTTSKNALAVENADESDPESVSTKTADRHPADIARAKQLADQSKSANGSVVTASAGAEANAATKKTATRSVQLENGAADEFRQATDAELPGTELDAASKSRVTQNSAAPTASTSVESAAAIDAELVAANSQGISENGTTTATSSSTTSGNELLGSVEKATNLLATSRSDSASQGRTEPTAPDTPTIDRARFVQRIGGAIRAAQQRDGQIQLRLSPPELGTLKIQLSVNEGAITANLETETAAARNVLLDNLPALRERLADQGISIEKFDVDVGRDGQQQTNTSSDGDRDSSSPTQPGEPATEADAPDQPTEQRSTTRTLNSDAGLDVQI